MNSIVIALVISLFVGTDEQCLCTCEGNYPSHYYHDLLLPRPTSGNCNDWAGITHDHWNHDSSPPVLIHRGTIIGCVVIESTP